MKRFSVISAALVAGAVLLGLQSPAVIVAQQAAGEIPFESVPHFFKLPDGEYFGEIAGVAVNSKGMIYVYSRSGSEGGHIIAPQAGVLYAFNPDGSFAKSVRGLYGQAWAHAVRVDKNDNVWLVDNGSDQVMRLSPDLKEVTLVLGRRRESVASTVPNAPAVGETPLNTTRPARPTVFNEPTDVTWDPAGNIFVSDGYKNQSVAKLDSHGGWVTRIGKGPNFIDKGNGPGEFANPHGIAADANGNVYVADRGNARIQVFDANLKHLRDIRINVPVPPDATITNTAIPTVKPGEVPPVMGGLFVPGSPWALCINPGPNQALFVADVYPGRVYKLSLDGTVLGYLGKNGKELKEFNWIHAIACPSENEIYVGELLTWRVQKLLLHPKTKS